MKQKIFAAYLAFGFLFAIYGWVWGDTAHKSLFYNLGIGIVWPAAMFPGLGKAIGGLIIVAFVVYITFVRKK
jgi:hypothetical protein